MRDWIWSFLLVLVLAAIHVVVVESAPQFRYVFFLSFGILFTVGLLAIGYAAEGWRPGYFAAALYTILTVVGASSSFVYKILDLGR